MPIDNQLYDRTGDIWWDDREQLSMLRTMLNPARFGFFRTVLMDEIRIDPAGRTALDVGCGGGLLAEEFARLGFLVTGVDPSYSSVLTARRHAGRCGLTIAYVAGTGELLPFADASCELVFCCDVLEHVASPIRVVAEIARVLKDDGIFFYDTINRTLRSRVAVIKIFQEWAATSCAPPNLHDWKKFIKPNELQKMMTQRGLEHRGMMGMKPGANLITLIRHMRKRKRGEISYGELGRRMKMHKTKDLSISYMGWAVKVK
jgi:2-polyprenyl-6-hydroxyphenyl methylase/3-demethylubiquinone-9 3-methyltransferase